MTVHAEEAIRQRELDLSWVKETVRNPDWLVADARQAGIERRFRKIDERDRVLRVAIVETDVEIRILTAFFDRRARRPS